MGGSEVPRLGGFGIMAVVEIDHPESLHRGLVKTQTAFNCFWWAHAPASPTPSCSPSWARADRTPVHTSNMPVYTYSPPHAPIHANALTSRHTPLLHTHPSSRFPPTAFLYAPCPFHRVPPYPPFMSTHTHRLHPDFQMILLVSQPAELWIIWDPFDSDAEPSKGSRESGKVESENKPGPSATAL